MVSIVQHYSELAFKTRVYALTFAGAVIGAFEWIWNTPVQPGVQNFLNFSVLAWTLLIVTGSLSFMNHRYRRNYIEAVRSLSLKSKPPESDIWKEYKSKTEEYYTPSKDDGKRQKFVKFFNRFMLSWGTFCPGILGSAYLLMNTKKSEPISFLNLTISDYFGFIIIAFLIGIWLWEECTPETKDKYKDKIKKILRLKGQPDVARSEEENKN